MEGTRDARLVSPDDNEWWTVLDEGYWQAVLAQGENPPETVPPLDPQEVFQTLDIETNSGTDLNAQMDAAADPEQEWLVATRAMERGESFSLVVSGANRGGVLVDWNGLQGFVPASHLTEIPRSRDPQQRMAELTEYVGQSLTVRFIEVDVEQKRLVFSERAALSEFRSPAAVLDSLKPGDVRRGTVTNLTSFGAFVDLGGVEGLIHVSEMSWDRVRHPTDVLRSGWEVDVYVLGVNPEEGRIALSLKRLRPNPWTEVESRYRVGQFVDGEVTNVVSFGAFVRLEEGLEGLIHISELAEGNFLHPRNVVREGDRVRVRVLSIDGTNQRLGLSLRQAHGVGSDHAHLRDTG
jgi:small subunit ribosomal protein S1